MFALREPTLVKYVVLQDIASVVLQITFAYRQLDEAYITPAISKLDDFVKSDLKNDVLELDFIPPGTSSFFSYFK